MSEREGTPEAMHVRSETFDRVVGGLARRDEERPVARLREQELAHGLCRGAVAKRIGARQGSPEPIHLASATLELVPHPRRPFVEPGRAIAVLSPLSFRQCDPFLRPPPIQAL